MEQVLEYIDVVDENDRVVGLATRQELYQKTLRHRIVHILLFNQKGDMALQLRGPGVDFCPNHWCTAAVGHVQHGESYQEAARREYQEELGIVADDLELVGKDLYIADGTPNKFLAIFKTNFEGPFRLDPNIVARAEFFSLPTIKKMVDQGEQFHPELLFILEKYFFKD